MSVTRKDATLNDAIDHLDGIYSRCQADVQKALSMLSHDEHEFIDDEIEKCLDLRYYLENYHCIRDESGNWKSFYPWFEYQEILYQAIQEEWEENESCKIIVLKPRQSGISTWTAASMFHRTIFTPRMYTMIVGQDADTTSHIYNMSMNAYSALPWWLKPEYMYKTKGDEIVFQRVDEAVRSFNDGLGSTLKCSNAKKMSGVAIGRSLQSFHGSEASRWADDGMFEADIKPSMNARDIYAIIESTGYGRQGFFYDHWRGALEEENGYRAVFIPVYRSRKYYLPFSRKDPNKNVVLREAFVLKEDEVKFNDRVKREESFDIPKEFWNFRRKGMLGAKRGNAKAGFMESYPLTPTEAFQASGICAFDRDKLEEQQMSNVCIPLYSGHITLGADDATPNPIIREVNPGEILPKRKGVNASEPLRIWVRPEQGATYELGVDSALGVKDGDYSACAVWRVGSGMQPDELVATWLGHAPPGFYARAVAALGYWYNGAEIACEYQGPGISVGDKLKDLDYPALYRPQHHDRVGNTMGVHLHWLTTIKTRDQIIGALNEALLEESVKIYDEDLIEECTDFGSLNGGSRFEGIDNKDDLCFPPGTLVDTPRGPIAIDDLDIGDTVYSHDGKEHKVSDMGVRSVDENLISVKVFGIDRPIVCTKNHPFLLRKRKSSTPVRIFDPVWAPASQISKNDFVYVPKKVLPNSKFTEDELYLLGWYLSDGYASNRSGAISFTFAKGDDESRVVKIVEKMVKDHPTMALCGKGKRNGNGMRVFTSKVQVKDYGEYRKLLTNNVWLNAWLKENAGPPNQKFVNMDIQSSVGTLALVSGFLEGDASQKNKRGAISVCQKNHDVLRAIREILVNHGIWSSIGPTLDRNGLMTMSICGEWVNKLVEDCPWIWFKKVERKLSHPIARADENGFWVQVQKIESVNYCGPVWNMEVEDTHTYLVNGVVVHNCMSSMIGLFCARETNKHIKSSPATENVRNTGNINSYGVYDNLMRQRGQYAIKEDAEKQIVGMKGWMVRPILICKANTLFSPIFDGMGSFLDGGSFQSELHYKHGMNSMSILPDVVNSYKEAMQGVGASGTGRNSDEW